MSRWYQGAPPRVVSHWRAEGVESGNDLVLYYSDEADLRARLRRAQNLSDDEIQAALGVFLRIQGQCASKVQQFVNQRLPPAQLASRQFSKALPITADTFALDDEVECRNGGFEWMRGIVTQVTPLTIRPFEWTEGQRFAEVRRVAPSEFKVTGQWMMIDEKTMQQFFYEFKQSSPSTFRGRQSGVGPIADGRIRGSEISWNIDGVQCTGMVADSGRRIVKGVYVKGGNGNSGSFMGRRVSTQIGSEFPIGCWIHVLDSFKVYPNHRKIADDLGLANWVEGAIPPEGEALTVIGSLRHTVLKDYVMAVQSPHGMQYLVSAKAIVKAAGPVSPPPSMPTKRMPPPPCYAANKLVVEPASPASPASDYRVAREESSSPEMTARPVLENIDPPGCTPWDGYAESETSYETGCSSYDQDVPLPGQLFWV